MKFVDEFLIQYIENKQLTHSPVVVQKLFEQKIEQFEPNERKTAIEYLQQKIQDLETAMYGLQEIKKLNSEEKVDWRQVFQKYDLTEEDIRDELTGVLEEYLEKKGFSDYEQILNLYQQVPETIRNNNIRQKILEKILGLHLSYSSSQRKNFLRQILKNFPDVLVLSASKVCKLDWHSEEKYALFQQFIDNESAREALAEFELSDFLELRRNKILDELFALYYEYNPIMIICQADGFTAQIDSIRGEPFDELLQKLLADKPSDVLKFLLKVDLPDEQKVEIYSRFMTENDCDLLHNTELLKYLGSSRIKYYKQITDLFPDKAKQILVTVLHEQDCKTIQECWVKLQNY